VYSYILGFSRFRIYEASLSQTLGSVFDALENSIIETKGSVERLQTDNAKCFITNASKEDFQWNVRYQKLCGHYSFKPTRSLPKHPWSKGKVERPFDFVEQQFIKGNEFLSYEDFYKRLKSFQDEVNNSVHSTTKQKPKDLYDMELSSLSALPGNRFVDIKEEVRKVSCDCTIQFQGNRYSVPYFFATKEVWLKISKGYILQIHSSQNKLIAEHILSLTKGAVIMKNEHYKDFTVKRENWQILSQNFLQIFPDDGWFIEKLKTQKKLNYYHQLSQVIEISKYYRNDDIRIAFSTCEKYNTYSMIFIRGYLENHCKIEQIVPQPIDKKILASIDSIQIKRPLSDYKLSNYQ
jgi:hypothetical protein